MPNALLQRSVRSFADCLGSSDSVTSFQYGIHAIVRNISENPRLFEVAMMSCIFRLSQRSSPTNVDGYHQCSMPYLFCFFLNPCSIPNSCSKRCVVIGPQLILIVTKAKKSFRTPLSQTCQPRMADRSVH